MLEDFFNALQNFRINKTRTLLSLLGIIIGVASVIVITTLGQSATANITSTFGDSGLDELSLSTGFMSHRGGASGSDITFDEDFRDDLWGDIEGLKAIFYKNSVSSNIRLDDGTEASVSCTAIEYGYLQAVGAELQDGGSWFSVSDNVMGAQKIILGSDVADSLFPDGDGVGKQVIVDTDTSNYGFKVIGILEDKDSGMESTASAAYIPRGFYIKKIEPNPDASGALVKVMDQDQTSAIEEAITDWVEEKTGVEDSIHVRSMATMLEKVDETLGTVSLLLAGVAAISLLVGGIGIMNIMIVTVTERQKEIGIRKALGATPGAIKSQFLIEAATITIIGGIFGIVLGVIISSLATYIMAWAFSIQWGAVLFSFLFSAFIGVFFGYNPAARASKLDPVEALASE